jgi:hypothetical protein
MIQSNPTLQAVIMFVQEHCSSASQLAHETPTMDTTVLNITCASYNVSASFILLPG